MTDPSSMAGGPGGPGPVSGPQGALPRSERAPDGGAAFKALLEKLEGQTREVRQASEEIDRPEELAGAADRAKASIQDALSLRDQLLEAYRASQQGTGDPGR